MLLTMKIIQSFIHIYCLIFTMFGTVKAVTFPASRNPFSGIMSTTDIPQFITITFDDAITPFTASLVKPLTTVTDKHGCGAKFTFYVSIQNNTKCNLVQGFRRGLHEIATHTYNHISRPSVDEIVGAIDYLNFSCNVPREEIKGFRTPNLDWDPSTFDNLKTAGLLYDSTIPSSDYEDSNFGRNTMWPFTLEPENIGAFQYDDSASRLRPVSGVWELPMNPKYNSDGTPNIDMDYINPSLEFFQDNLLRRYNGNRAPLGIFLHAGYLVTNGALLKSWMESVVATYDDVYFVTSSEVLNWMQNPVPKQLYSNTCTNQVKGCVPTDAQGCLFGTFNASTCSCECFPSYCVDDQGICTKTTGCPVSSSSGSTTPSPYCCPGGMSGLRAFNDCKEFYHCSAGSVVGSPIPCLNGTVFDESHQGCNRPSAVTLACVVDTCGMPTAPTPVVRTEPVPAPAPSPYCCPNGMTGYRAFNKCTQYYRCVNGEVIGDPGTCASGLKFHATAQVCDWESSVTSCVVDSCGAPTPAPTPRALVPAPTPAPTKSPTPPPVTPTPKCCPKGLTALRAYNQCKQYYSCVFGAVSGEPVDCPSGTLFNSTAQVCAHASLVTSCVVDTCDVVPTPAPTPKALVPAPTPPPTKPPTPPPVPPTPKCCPNGLTANRAYNQCKQYYSCVYGAVSGEVVNCPAGTLFNSTAQVCDHASLVTSCVVDTCDVATKTEALMVPTPPPTKPPTLPPGPPAPMCCPNGMTAIRAYNQCTQYYQCAFGAVYGEVYTCRSDMLFDATAQVCNWKSLVTSCVVDTCDTAPRA